MKVLTTIIIIVLVLFNIYTLYLFGVLNETKDYYRDRFIEFCETENDYVPILNYYVPLEERGGKELKTLDCYEMLID